MPFFTTVMLLTVILRFSHVLSAPSSTFEGRVPENLRLATYCQVWGMLKYYHPKIATGALDGDSLLVTYLPKVLAAKTDDEFQKILHEFLEVAGPFTNCPDCPVAVPDTLNRNLDLDWIHDTRTLSEFVSEYLQKLVKNRYWGKRKYVRFDPEIGHTFYDGEKAYPEMVLPSEPYRLLALFRFWNVIEYFYPYKYALDYNWKVVLHEMIPIFRAAKDTLAYHLAVRQLAMGIQDTHAYVKDPWFEKNIISSLEFPAIVRYLEKKVVVVDFPNDSVRKQIDLEVGDVIEDVDGEPIEARIARLKPYIEASNPAKRMHELATEALYANSDTLALIVRRRGETIATDIPVFTWKSLNLRSERRQGRASLALQYRVIKDSIGYVNMHWFNPRSKEKLDAMIEELWDTKAIIFDIRNYPFWLHQPLLARLTDEARKFVQPFVPDSTFPGAYRWLEYEPVGEKNGIEYHGKVVVLVDERSVSYSEYFTMALQTLPNCTVIGGQTAGADGNISFIKVPGDIRLTMTGVGYFYPDGRETQRVGIKIDIEAHQTISGLQAGRDEVLERALEFISEGQ